MIPVLEVTLCDVAGDPWEGRAMVRFQGAASEPFPVREGMTAKQRNEVRWYIEEFMDLPEGGNVVRAQQVEEQLAGFGRELWARLKSDVSRAWLDAVRSAGAGRLELRAERREDEATFRTPWELMRVDAAYRLDGGFLHELGVSVVRRVTAERPSAKVAAASNGLRVLVIVCRPDDARFLDPRSTPRAILSALQSRPEVSVDFCRPGTLDALVKTLDRAQTEQRSYRVVHFNGHGKTLLKEERGVLYFEREEGCSYLVDGTQFGAELSRFGIPLVVLEACHSATKTSVQDTVATALLREGIGTVVAMSHAAHVDMTRELMAAFYEGIARGGSLGGALQAARNHLHRRRKRRTHEATDAPTVELEDWFVPQLYQGNEDPCLLEGPVSAAPRREPPPLVGFPDEPRAGFRGRARELHRLERALLAHRAVVVHGLAGMGKTALVREAAYWLTRTGLFADGAVFVSLEGNPSPDQLVRMVAEAFECRDFYQGKDQIAWIEEQLAQRQMLLVWDNYDSVRPAFNAGQPTPPEFAELARRWTRGGSRVLITCRDDQSGLDAHPFPLGELSRPESLLLLVSSLDRLQIDHAQREKDGWTAAVLEPIVERVGGHPLALELLAPQIPQLGPQRVLDELSELLNRLRQDAPEGRNRSMRASLDFSIRHMSVASRTVLPAVALLSGGCLEAMARHVVALRADAWQQVRRELEHAGLVRGENGCLRPHPVLGEMLPSFSGKRRATARVDVNRSIPLPAITCARVLDDVVPAVEGRFLAVVRDFAIEFYELVRTRNATTALKAMADTELVARRAIQRAVGAGQMEAAVTIATSMKVYLDRTGRGGEGAALITRLLAQTAGSHGIPWAKGE